MTPQEIEAQADALQQLLVAHGVTPEAALTAEGRERARPRFQQAMDRAERYGYQELRQRIEAMVEAEAQRHARRGMRRTAIDATAGERQAPPAAAPSRPVVAPPLPVAGAPGPMPMDLGPIDYAAPVPGGAPQETAGSTQPPLADAISRWGLEQGGTVGDLAVRAGRGVGDIGRFAGDVSGYFRGQRAVNAFDEGRPLEGVGHAAMAAIPYRPALGLGALGAAYGTALGQTFAPSMIDTAEAQPRQRPQPAPQPSAPSTTLPGLDAEQQKLFNDTQRRITAGGFSSGAERRQLEETLRDLRGISSDFVKAQNAAKVKSGADKAASDQAERNRAVEDAERIRRQWEARDTQWKDTPVGQFNEAMGGYGALAAGALMGGLTRGAGRVMGHGDSVGARVGWPMGTGAFGGATAANAPQYYNSTQLDVMNPRRRALEEYAAVLPEDHPRRAQTLKRLEDTTNFPVLNPIQQEASRQMGLWPTVGRSLWGAVVEGAPGGLAGSEGARLLEAGVRAGGRGIASLFGRRPAGGTTGGPGPGGGGPGGGGPGGQGGQGGQGLTLAQRQRDRSYSIPRNAPVAPGEVETWVSPAGNKVITRDASGNLRDGNRWIGKNPPPKYRRIAEAEATNLLAAYG